MAKKGTKAEQGTNEQPAAKAKATRAPKKFIIIERVFGIGTTEDDGTFRFTSSSTEEQINQSVYIEIGGVEFQKPSEARSWLKDMVLQNPDLYAGKTLHIVPIGKIISPSVKQTVKTKVTL